MAKMVTIYQKIVRHYVVDVDDDELAEKLALSKHNELNTPVPGNKDNLKYHVMYYSGANDEDDVVIITEEFNG